MLGRPLRRLPGAPAWWRRQANTARRTGHIVILMLALVPASTSIASETPTHGEATSREAIRFEEPVDDVLGSSVEGEPIVARRWNASAGAAVLVIGAIHGDERESGHLPEVLDRRWMARPDRLGGHHVILIFRLNPDGWKRKTRKSARLVDLNRNFPAGWRASKRRSATHGGAAPLSEPEARVLHRLLTDEPIAAIVALHSCRRCGGVNNYDGPAREFAHRMSALNGYKATGEWPQPTPGSLGTFAGRDRGIPTITLEMPRGMPDAHLASNAAAIEALIEAVNAKSP